MPDAFRRLYLTILILSVNSAIISGKRQTINVSPNNLPNIGDFVILKCRFDTYPVMPRWSKILTYENVKSLYGVDPGSATDCRIRVWEHFKFDTSCGKPIDDNYAMETCSLNDSRKSKTSDFNLRIKYVRPIDKGIWDCYSSEYGSVQIYLNVKVPPRTPSVSGFEQPVLSGTRHKLTCDAWQFGVSNNITYEWYKNKVQVSEGAVLLFDQVQISDGGTYHCVASNSVGTTTSAKNDLIVQGSVVLHASISPNGSTDIGVSVVLECQFDSPVSKAGWYLESTKGFVPLRIRIGVLDANVAHDPCRISEEYDQRYSWESCTASADSESAQRTFSLRINSVRPEDAGIWRCEAQNSIGFKESGEVFLKVKVPPKVPVVSGFEKPVLSGYPHVLTCDAWQHGVTEDIAYTWFKDEVQLTTEPVVSFSHLRTSDSGNYRCTARNSAGATESIGKSLIVYQSFSIAAIILAYLGGCVTAFVISLAAFSLKYYTRKTNQKTEEVGSRSQAVSDDMTRISGIRRSTHLPTGEDTDAAGFRSIAQEGVYEELKRTMQEVRGNTHLRSDEDTDTAGYANVPNYNDTSNDMREYSYERLDQIDDQKNNTYMTIQN